jgi:uncharacterized protein YndB with AHSA1/START domain
MTSDATIRLSHEPSAASQDLCLLCRPSRPLGLVRLGWNRNAYGEEQETMKKPLVEHGSFSIERTYDASPKDVFAAWSHAESKARWFVGPENWTVVKRELDFRIGGHELLHGRLASGRDTIYTARFHDIVPDARIVYVYDMHYDMHGDKTHLSVSIATVEFEPVNQQTRLVFAEQVAFLDGTNAVEGTSSREHGTAAHLERLRNHLRPLHKG